MRPVEPREDPAGDRDVERILAAMATCRRRGRDVPDDFAARLHARLDGAPAPALLAGT